MIGIRQVLFLESRIYKRKKPEAEKGLGKALCNAWDSTRAQSDAGKSNAASGRR